MKSNLSSCVVTCHIHRHDNHIRSTHSCVLPIENLKENTFKIWKQTNMLAHILEVRRNRWELHIFSFRWWRKVLKTREKWDHSGKELCCKSVLGLGNSTELKPHHRNVALTKNLSIVRLILFNFNSNLIWHENYYFKYYIKKSKYQNYVKLWPARLWEWNFRNGS